MICGRNKKAYLIIIIFMITSACALAQKSIKYDDVYNKAEESFKGVIKKLNIPVKEIDIDRVTAKPLEPKIIIDPDKSGENEKYYLAYTKSIIAHRDSLFIADCNQNTIFIANYDGKIIKSIGREGRGPGEFKYLQYMAENKNYFFAYDVGNQRVQIFNKKFKYLKSLPAQFTPSGRGIAANKDYLILNEKGAVPFDITSYSLKGLSLKKSNFIDKNFAFNVDLQRANFTYGMQIDASSENYTAAAVSMHPYIFIFDKNGNALYSIKYEGKRINEMKRKNIPGHFVMSALGIKIIKNKLFVLTPGKMFIYDLERRSINKVYSLLETDAYTFGIFENTLFTAALGKVYKSYIEY
jgi:hypothetical protein